MPSDSPFATLQQAAIKALPEFTGDDDENVTKFINAIEHIGSFTNWNESAIHTLATIKFSGPAFNWYTNNKDMLNTWSTLKSNLLDRFQPPLSTIKAKLKTRQQQPGESLSRFYDDIIELCKQVDKNMPMHMIVDYLLDGVRADLRLHIKRRMATESSDASPSLFLTIARVEEALQQDESFASPSSLLSQPYFGPVAVTAKSSTKAPRASLAPGTSSNNRVASTSSRNSAPPSVPSDRSVSTRPFRPCLVCNGSNHRTIDCNHRQSTGCFKCGDPTHVVHDCPAVFQ